METSDNEDDSNSQEEGQEEEDDYDYRHRSDHQKDSPINLSLVAIELDRAGVSNRAGARICNALFTTLGIIDDNNTTAVIDRHRIKRARKEIRAVLTAQNLDQNQRPRCLYFDGKKDCTKVQVKKNDKLRSETVTEDHYSMTSPEGRFIGHVTVPGGVS